MRNQTITPQLHQAVGVPLQQRFFEDYFVGLSETHGAELIVESEVLEFAGRFDPQWIHTDRSAATAGPFGGLIASGWHTAALVMRIMVDSYMNENASLGGIGVDELRWPAPARPGDVITASFTVAEARRSVTKPDRGIVRTDVAAFRQGGAPLLTMTTISMLRSRQTVPPA
ncbi:MaoC family dehydratase [Arthrobacter sp. ISL-5]|uniref:MaoC family dehydratase n=1 Tax=Arthrobacter sp. ISL-5 TaxID=2819111 RepID=UPI001BE7843B|nr:MaoC family dehydratase [Arthrobacter sp. ISL-5]MBT2554185.1 MaoC family dehydratase [Arthrobacter sp. ISL-5]